MGIQDSVHIGNVYNRLTVISHPYRVNKHWYVMCRCSCDAHVEKQIRIDSLVTNKIKSCGCLAKEHGYTQGKNSRKPNTYDLSGEFGVGYTRNYNSYGENWFYFDLEDYDKICKYTWCFDADGYLMTMIDKHNVKMHRLIMDFPDKLEIDHIYHDSVTNHSSKNDNRKSNLRVCTHKDNCKNRLNRTDRFNGIIQTPLGFKRYSNGTFLGWFDTYQEAKDYLINSERYDAVTVDR